MSDVQVNYIEWFDLGIEWLFWRVERKCEKLSPGKTYTTVFLTRIGAIRRFLLQSQVLVDECDGHGARRSWKLTLSKEPFSRFEPHIGDSPRQTSAFGFVKTGKTFGVPQLFGSEHERVP
jgi:hypothetical protein